MTLTCAWREPLNVDDEDFPSGDLCGAPAKWLSCAPYINIPTCDKHKCRCRIPINGPAPVASTVEQERDALRAERNKCSQLAGERLLEIDALRAQLEAMTKRADEAERQRDALRAERDVYYREYDRVDGTVAGLKIAQLRAEVERQSLRVDQLKSALAELLPWATSADGRCPDCLTSHRRDPEHAEGCGFAEAADSARSALGRERRHKVRTPTPQENRGGSNK